MIRNKLVCLFIALLTLMLTGCGAGSITREYHRDSMESAEVRGYSGTVERKVSVSDGQAINFYVKLSHREGNILVTIVDRNGISHFSLNERATLDEDNGMLVTAPTEGQPYSLSIDMKHFTGEYEVSWANSAE